MVDFPRRLKHLRKDKHLTQVQVAERIGVTASMVSSYETDIRLPSYGVMLRIADVFGVSVDYLLGRQKKRFGDISDLSEEEASVVCDMVNILRSRKQVTFITETRISITAIGFPASCSSGAYHSPSRPEQR